MGLKIPLVTKVDLSVLYENDIGNISTIDNQYINDLCEVYSNTITSESVKDNSRYQYSEGYFAYVYSIFDRILNKWYIGVRITDNKFSTDPLEDLKKYQTSSKDKTFKKNLKESIDIGDNRFELVILYKCDNELVAKNYEALCHQIFDIDINPLFFNRSAEVFKQYITFREIYWDLKDDTPLTFKELRGRGVSIQSMYALAVTGILTICRNRYCLKSTLPRLGVGYKKRYKKIKLFYITEGCCRSETKYYYEWLNLLGNRFHQMFCNGDRPKYKSVNGYYYEYENLKFEMEGYEVVDMYYYSDRQVHKLSKTKKEWREVRRTFGEIFIGRQTSITENGVTYYTNAEECRDNHLEYVLLDTATNQPVHKIYRKDGNKVVGNDFMRLVNGRSKRINGFEFQLYNSI